jgi:hypothetical protein
VLRAVVVGCSTAGLLTLTACSGSPAADPDPSRSSTRASSAASTASPSASPGVPEPGSMAEPATSSGSLDKASFPRPRRLGAGWAYSVDPGNVEEGYAGNGTPALARNPREVVQTAVPFGCARRTSMPAPAHALEVDYTHDGRKVVAVRSQFDDAPTAREFFTARTANLRACAGRSGGPAIGRLVTGLGAPDARSLLSDRTPDSDPWRELAVLDGDSVVLVAVQGAGRPTLTAVRRLAEAFRR